MCTIRGSARFYERRDKSIAVTKDESFHVAAEFKHPNNEFAESEGEWIKGLKECYSQTVEEQ